MNIFYEMYVKVWKEKGFRIARIYLVIIFVTYTVLLSPLFIEHPTAILLYLIMISVGYIIMGAVIYVSIEVPKKILRLGVDDIIDFYNGMFKEEIYKKSFIDDDEYSSIWSYIDTDKIDEPRLSFHIFRLKENLIRLKGAVPFGIGIIILVVSKVPESLDTLGISYIFDSLINFQFIEGIKSLEFDILIFKEVFFAVYVYLIYYSEIEIHQSLINKLTLAQMFKRD